MFSDGLIHIPQNVRERFGFRDGDVFKLVVSEDGKITIQKVAKDGTYEQEPSMSLWTMQDLVGCRFIVPTVRSYTYANKYKNSRIRHKFVNSYDYISTPKKSGY